MKKPKYCETLKPGFYLLRDETLNLHRCVYCTGTTKGNKWIELDMDGNCLWSVKEGDKNGGWTGLFWNCISEEEINESVYSETNPTKINLKIK